jgi:SAM-dependent methyltransferase
MTDAIPPEIESIDYIERWRDMVERRRVQMESAYAANGVVNSDYWGKRAKNYRQALHSRMEEDPFLMRVRAAVSPTSTVLDVGAGTGRHTLAIAAEVGHITAVDPSKAMLDFLRADVQAGGLSNVDVVQAEWMDADVPAADVVLCSHVLYPIAKPLPFIRKLEAQARERVFVYLRVDPLPTEMGLWSEFYGIPLQSQPTALDLMNLLAQADIYADFEVVNHRLTLTFESVDDAVTHVKDALCLNETDEIALARLRSVLQERLKPWPDGRLGPDVAWARTAIMSWKPGADPAGS